MKAMQLIVGGIAAAAFVLGSANCSMAQQKKDEHGHKQEPKGHAHGSDAISNDLGTTEIAGIKLSATQEAVIEAGSEAAFDVIIAEGQKKPKAVRSWFGVPSGEGSVKTKGEAEDKGHYHCHVEVPKKIPAGSMWWLEVEPEAGKKAKAGFSVKVK